jgi:predicted metalloprotease
MRWRDRKGSENVEDRRDEDGGGGFNFPFPGGDRGGFPGGRMPIPMGRGGGLGVFGVIVVIGLMLLFGIDPRVILEGPEGEGGRQVSFPGGGGDDARGRVPSLPRDQQPSPLPRAQIPGRETRAPATPPGGGQRVADSQDEMKQFVSVVLQTTEEVWQQKFRQSGKTYQEPKLVLYRDSVSSGCGTGMSQMGPFYCPLDAKVYVDLAFYNDLKRRFNAPGDFAQAYVIAHEVGHHVQTLLGITEQVMRAKSRTGERQQNALQVRMELQADCLAGIWAYYAQHALKVVDPGDIDEALGAAAAIGDDRIQRQVQGRVTPDSFTHGSSEQRVRWFRRGFENGSFPSCDTFSADEL